MINCENITKTYITGDVETQVLRGVSFTIAKGEFVAIMGPSGSGKSTLMHILGALDRPTSGTYTLDNQDVGKMTEEGLALLRCRKIGFVFQQFHLLPRATVLRNVMLPLVYAGTSQTERKKLAEESLRSAGLPEDRWGHLSNQLSGGQIQRVAIARSLVNNPALLLADEPTGNLDTKTGQIVLQTFQRIHKELGHTIVVITHEPEVAQHAQRILHIRDGLLVKEEKGKG